MRKDLFTESVSEDQRALFIRVSGVRRCCGRQGPGYLRYYIFIGVTIRAKGKQHSDAKGYDCT